MKVAPYFILFVSLLVNSCESAKTQEEKALRLYKEHNYEEALKAINASIEQEPDSISHYGVRILILNSTGQYKQELPDLTRVIELNKLKGSKSLNAHLTRAIAQNQVGLYKETLSDINYFIENRDASSKTPGELAGAYLNKGSILYNLKETNQAKRYYELAIQENRGREKEIDAQAYVGLANVAASPTEELRLLNKAIALDDNTSLAYGARAGVYMAQGKYKEAYGDYRRSLQLSPADAKVNFNLGQLFANYFQENDSAVVYYERALQLAPDDPGNAGIYRNLAVLKQKLGKPEEALANAEKSEALNPDDDVLLYNYALLLSDLDRNKEALEKINRAIQLKPKEAEYFGTKGSVLLSMSAFDEAERGYRQALALNPKFGGAAYNLGYMLSQKGDSKQAILAYDRAVLLKHDLEATLVNRALEKIKLGENAGACADLNRAYKLGRTDIRPLIDKNCN